MMVGVITGDLIKSRSVKHPELWLTALKQALGHLSSDSSTWELYRGDSFQIEVSAIEDSFRAALYIKACLKSVKGLDARMAIGIGTKSFEGQKISESNGEAFVFSGALLETLKKEKTTLKIKTAHTELDRDLNLYFKFAAIIMDNWTANSAEIVKLALEQPDALQETLGRQIGINQNAVSNRQKRAHLDVLMELNDLYRQKITQIK